MNQIRKKYRLSQVVLLAYVLRFVTIMGLSCGILSNCSPGSANIAHSQEETLFHSSNKSFQFPLRKIRILTGFNSFKGAFKDQHHAAEDFRAKAGTPVYAVADGRVSFSGKVKHPIIPIQGIIAGWQAIPFNPLPN